jgi:hypothetical protein
MLNGKLSALRVLKLMNKWITGVSNVNTLCWAHTMGRPWLEADLRLLRRGTGRLHYPECAPCGRFLQPPVSVEESGRNVQPSVPGSRSVPVRQLQPLAAYKYIYPARVHLDRLAYFFDYIFENSLPNSIFMEAKDIVEQWKKSWESNSKPRLTFCSTHGCTANGCANGASNCHCLTGLRALFPRALDMSEYAASTYGERIAKVSDRWYAGQDTEGTVEFLFGLAKGGDALELGIDTGRVALPLSAHGVKVRLSTPRPRWWDKMRIKPGGEKVPVTLGDFADVPGSRPLRSNLCSVQYLFRTADSGGFGQNASKRAPKI